MEGRGREDTEYRIDVLAGRETTNPRLLSAAESLYLISTQQKQGWIRSLGGRGEVNPMS